MDWLPKYDNPLDFVGTFLLILGVFLVLVGFGVLVMDKISLKRGPVTWILGILVFYIGLSFLYSPITEISTLPTATLQLTSAPSPRIYDFAACLLPCNGSNSLNIFPPKTTNIYLIWKYENIPSGAHVVRTWKIVEKDIIWIRYDCSWSGSSSGSVSRSLYDGNGLASGTWELTMSVNDVVLLKQQILIQGSWNNPDSNRTHFICF